MFGYTVEFYSRLFCVCPCYLVPSGTTKDLTIADVNTQQISFGWSPPECGKRHGKIVFYEYQFGEDILDGRYTSTSTTSMIAQLNDLSPSTWYDFRVRAHTTQGGGPFTEIVGIKTLDSGKMLPIPVL